MVIIVHQCFPVSLSHRETLTKSKGPVDKFASLIKCDSVSAYDVSSLLIFVSDHIVSLPIDLKANVIISLCEKNHLIDFI